jgi:hypothetical protein
VTDRQIEYLLMCCYEYTQALKQVRAQLRTQSPERVQRAVWRVNQARRRTLARSRYWCGVSDG